MKKNIIYTITGICIILAATTPVTGKNTTGKTNAAYVTQMKNLSHNMYCRRNLQRKSYTAYVREDESNVVYIQDRKDRQSKKDFGGAPFSIRDYVDRMVLTIRQSLCIPMSAHI